MELEAGMPLSVLFFWLVVTFSVLPTDTARTSIAVPLKVQQETCTFILPKDVGDTEYYLIIGSLTQDTQTHEITLKAQATREPAHLPVMPNPVDKSWQTRMQSLKAALSEARKKQQCKPISKKITPPEKKAFFLFTGDGPWTKLSAYTAVVGQLRKIGKHCQVYTDSRIENAKTNPMPESLCRCFDETIYPHINKKYGVPADVDEDGRVTILLSPLLSRLQGGKVKVTGFVRGSDYLKEFTPPYGNRCDVLYLNSEETDQAFLHSVLVHEYMHAVILTHHVLREYVPGLQVQDEESWLNEAICHMVEDESRFSWANLDHRIDAYLKAPHKYPLVVPNYYEAKMWRTAGTRGATYLFLRWCADKYGPDLLPALVKSNLHGIANLEAFTLQPFPHLFREWAVAQLLSGSEVAVLGVSPYRTHSLRATIGRFPLTGPLTETITAPTERKCSLSGTSLRYFRLNPVSGKLMRWTVSASAKTGLQVTLLRLPPGVSLLRKAEKDTFMKPSGKRNLPE